MNGYIIIHQVNEIHLINLIFLFTHMNPKPINFRTKTHQKTRSLTLSQQFTQIQKVLTEYEKKKFHPKIQNFKYMSTQSIGTTTHKRRFLLKKDAQTLSSQKIFGPLPQVFVQSDIKKKTERSYDISQITFASSEEKEAYTKMSKLRNPERRKKLNQAYPKYSERYIQTMNKSFMEMLGKQVELINSPSNKEVFEDDEKQFVEFQKQRNFIEIKSDLKRDLVCKKYAQTELDEFLEDDTKLTMSQKRRITEYKKRDELIKDSEESSSCRKKMVKIPKRQKSFILINDHNHDEKQKRDSHSPLQDIHQEVQDQGINFSSKGWMIIQNNESNLITL